MYVPDILTAALSTTDERTRDLPLMDEGGIQIGIWEIEPGTAGDPGGDYDETMFMVSGRLTVDRPEGALDVAPGTLWATPRGWGSTWRVHQTVRKLYVIDHRPGDAAPGAHLPNAFTAPVGEATPRPVVLAGDPREATASLWAHNRIDTGVWECTPGEFPFRRDGYHETFCVLGGHATLHVDGGDAFDLHPGAVVLTPAGTTGRWVVHETIRKAYTTVTL